MLGRNYRKRFLDNCILPELVTITIWCLRFIVHVFFFAAFTIGIYDSIFLFTIGIYEVNPLLIIILVRM